MSTLLSLFLCRGLVAKRTGMRGASRSSSCELDANDPKVNSVAGVEPAGRRLLAADRVRKMNSAMYLYHHLRALAGSNAAPQASDVLHRNTLRSSATVAPGQHSICGTRRRNRTPAAVRVFAGCKTDSSEYPAQNMQGKGISALTVTRLMVEDGHQNSFALEVKPHMGYNPSVPRCIRCRMCCGVSCRCDFRMRGYWNKFTR
jgi:hypothetical protein